MAFRWVYLNEPRSESGSSEEFATREAAEVFMGDSYKKLLAEGHLAARLVDGDDVLYTMKLTPG